MTQVFEESFTPIKLRLVVERQYDYREDTLAYMARVIDIESEDDLIISGPQETAKLALETIKSSFDQLVIDRKHQYGIS